MKHGRCAPAQRRFTRSARQPVPSLPGAPPHPNQDLDLRAVHGPARQVSPPAGAGMRRVRRPGRRGRSTAPPALTAGAPPFYKLDVTFGVMRWWVSDAKLDETTESALASHLHGLGVIFADWAPRTMTLRFGG